MNLSLSPVQLRTVVGNMSPTAQAAGMQQILLKDGP